MQRNTNSYTVIYAAVMTVVVAVVLSLAASGLKPRQDYNVALSNKIDILKSIGKNSVQDPATFYAENIQELVVDFEGNIVEKDATGNVLIASAIDLKKESRKAAEERMFPLYKYSGEEGVAYIIPMRGFGLWDEIWGYVALKEDMNTIIGVSFDHKSETPGLGAEIKDNPNFGNQFLGKRIFDEQGQFVSVEVIKGLISKPEHQVDGVSGATVTSQGVSEMLYSDLKDYLPFFNVVKKSSNS